MAERTPLRRRLASSAAWRLLSPVAASQRPALTTQRPALDVTHGRPTDGTTAGADGAATGDCGSVERAALFCAPAGSCRGVASTARRFGSAAGLVAATGGAGASHRERRRQPRQDGSNCNQRPDRCETRCEPDRGVLAGETTEVRTALRLRPGGFGNACRARSRMSSHIESLTGCNSPTAGTAATQREP